MTASSDYTDPQIKKDEILFLDDSEFRHENVCIVTGAGSGIGRGVAIAAAANGLMTIGLGRRAEAGEETVEIARQMGGDMVFIPTDLTRDEDIENVVRQAAEMGNIRYLANIAGIQHINSVEDFPMEKYDWMQRLMLRAPFYLSKLVIPHMKKNKDQKGVIANMGSIHAHICTMNKPVYGMMKFGLRALSQSISAEGKGLIRSFTVTTPYVKTPLTMYQIPSQARQRHISEQAVIDDVMLGRSRVKELMAPIEAGNIFMFGFSQYARFLVGSDLMLDGGMVLTY